MEATGLVPLFYHHDIEVAKAVLKACYQGGARLLEFTNRGDAAINTFKALSQFAKTSAWNNSRGGFCNFGCSSSTLHVVRC